MKNIINGLKQIKTRVDSGEITTANGTETLLSEQLASMLEQAINHTHSCTDFPSEEIIKSVSREKFNDWRESEAT